MVDAHGLDAKRHHARHNKEVMVVIDKQKLEALWKKYKGNGQVRNFSSKILWVVESDTNDPYGPSIAHKLLPNTKSPKKIDADGFKRVDGKAIDGHRAWWKIVGYAQADVFDRGQDLTINVLIRTKVSENEFGAKVEFDAKETWGVPIRQITDIKRASDGSIEKYFVDGLGWITKSKACLMAAKRELDGVVLVIPKKGNPYLRTTPDKKSENNFGSLA